MTKPRKTKFPRSLVVPIVGNGAIAGPIADGRLLPVLILDTSVRPEVAELVRVHAHLPPGDAESQWGSSPDDSDQVMLHLTFTQPMNVELVLMFSIEHEAILVETMLRGGGVYLQAGDAGDRLSTTPLAPRVLVELPDTGFGPHWDTLLLNRMTRVMAQRLALQRSKARPIAQEFVDELRKLARLRLAR